MTETLVWILTSCLMLVGFVGVLLPILPGTTLILIASVLHRLFLPESIAWSVIAWIGVIWLASILADFAGVVIGTRWFGGSKWGMAGAGGGSLVGMFISLPALILGTVVGAALAEKVLAKKSTSGALKAGLGAATGFVLSTVARLICAGVIIAVFLSAALP